MHHLTGLLTLTILATFEVAESGATPPPTLPPNPIVQEMVDAVSAEELGSTIETLESFYTRHTNSDTVSATWGIGAARNWIYSRFSEFALQPPGRLSPDYFTFDTTICGRDGRHRNVLATIPGVASPKRSFLVGGHMDSRADSVCDDTTFAPGANDDGSGTAIAIELARVMSRERFDADVVFMAFTGEEQGLFGSRAYAAWLKAQDMRIDGMISNDIVGNIMGCTDPACPVGATLITDSTRVRHFSAGPATSIHRQLARAMKLNAARYVPGFEVDLIPARDRPNRGGDHMAFDVLGYPAARFTEAHEFGSGSGSNGRQHNAHDLAERVNVGYVTQVARITLAGIANLTLAPETPASPTVVVLSESSMQLTWPSVATAPDLAGYRVAFRDTAVDSVFYFEIRDVGMTPGQLQELVLADIGREFPVFVSVSAYDSSMNESRFSDEVLAAPRVVEVPPVGLNSGTSLGRPQPNPTRTGTLVQFELAWPGNVVLEIFDVEGRTIRRLASRRYEPGMWSVAWDGTDARNRVVSPGVYTVRLRVDGTAIASRTIVRLK